MKNKRLEIRISEKEEKMLFELCKLTNLNKSNIIIIALNNFYNLQKGNMNEWKRKINKWIHKISETC